MKSFLIGVGLSLVGVSGAQAACDVQKATVSGIVMRGNAPVADVQITADFRERLAGEVSVLGQTDADGNFSIELDYSSYNGKSVLGKERCDFELEELTLTAEKGGKGKATITVALKDGRQDGTIRLDLK